MPDEDDEYACVCGLTYERFRTGLTFGCVRSMMWSDSTDPADWRYKTRRMVLGYWHQLKLGMWRSHCAECDYYEQQDPEGFAEWIATR